ncbi:acetolactate synthase large subunit [Klebsiella pneumoniae]|uniref:Acetolactate synthase large subunit n=1 Tax=Klebsiella pneumoniae TaxID=573 RepID=A0A447RUM0_KLEPN|nr:acetolactate synthase large subunit [Klebsiella pneumoniae]
MARTEGKPAVCMACSGPGATNLVTAIADARLDSIPLVCITGQVPASMIGTDAFQEVDTYGISIPITKHNLSGARHCRAAAGDQRRLPYCPVRTSRAGVDRHS